MDAPANALIWFMIADFVNHMERVFEAARRQVSA
jgi:hypothetical protein